MVEDIYQSLAARMNEFSIGAVQNDALLAILRELFSTEEAQLAALMTPNRWVPPAALAERTGLPREQVEAVLDAMATKGLVWGRISKGALRYRLLAMMPGIVELQMMKPSPLPAKSRIAHLFEEYDKKGFQEAVHQGTAWARVLTVEQEIPSEIEVFPYERVSEIIDNATSLSLSTCYCREEKGLVGEGCDAPKDVCMQFGPFADWLVEKGFAQRATKEDVLRALDRAEKAGLVHTTNNAQTGVSHICNCCGDCCAVLAGITKLNRPDSIATSNFRASVDEAECVGCEACLDRCQVNALSMPEAVVAVDNRRCIGCGLCVSACPTNALALRRREELSVPHWSLRELEEIRLAERGLL